MPDIVRTGAQVGACGGGSGSSRSRAKRERGPRAAGGNRLVAQCAADRVAARSRHTISGLDARPRTKRVARLLPAGGNRLLAERAVSHLVRARAGDESGWRERFTTRLDREGRRRPLEELHPATAKPRVSVLARHRAAWLLAPGPGLPRPRHRHGRSRLGGATARPRRRCPRPRRGPGSPARRARCWAAECLAIGCARSAAVAPRRRAPA